jgi:hypothetical protein
LVFFFEEGKGLPLHINPSHKISTSATHVFPAYVTLANPTPHLIRRNAPQGTADRKKEQSSQGVCAMQKLKIQMQRLSPVQSMQKK